MELLQYVPQHPLRILPETDEVLTPKQLEKLIHKELADRVDDKLDDNFVYVLLKVTMDKVNTDDIKALETLFLQKNAVLCKIQKIIPELDLSTIVGTQKITSIDDILDRDPMETLRETFSIAKRKVLSPDQEQMLKALLQQVKNE